MIDRHHVEPLRAALAGERHPARGCRLRGLSQGLQRHARQAARGHRPLRAAPPTSWRRSTSPASTGCSSRCARAATASPGLSICDDGILIDLGGLKQIEVDAAARPARAGRRRPLGRIRRRHPGARAAHAGRPRHDHRRRRVHHRRRLRLDVLEARPDLRQPALRRGRAGRRQRRQRPASTRTPTSSGVSAAAAATSASSPSSSLRLHPLGPDRARRARAVADRARPRGHARLARLRRQRARRALHGLRRHHRSARAVRARSTARAGGARHGGDVRRRSRGRARASCSRSRTLAPRSI